MRWIESDDGLHWYARGGWRPGERQVYLVIQVMASPGDVTSVRLTRMPESVPMHGAFPREAAALANMIEFPLGRGPGRPAGAPEVHALLAMAREYAEKFEDGESLEGYPYWLRVHGLDPGFPASEPEDIELPGPPSLPSRRRPCLLPRSQGVARAFRGVDFSAVADELRESFNQLGPDRALHGLGGEPVPDSELNEESYEITYRPGQGGGSSADGRTNC